MVNSKNDNNSKKRNELWHDERGKFRPGNPGRPKGALNYQGFNRAITLISRFIGEDKQLRRLRKHLEQSFEKNPLGTFMKIILPCMPKNWRFDFEETDGKMTIILQGPGKVPGQRKKLKKK